MAKFTRGQIERLKPYEVHFRTAVYSDYIRGAGELDKRPLVEAMEEATGLKYGDMLRETCGSCVTRFVKEVGTLYFESIDALVKEEVAKAAAELAAEKAAKAAKSKARRKEAAGK